MRNLVGSSRRILKLTPVRTVVLSFFLIIILGMVLLMLPISSRGEVWTPWQNALFTATSATCVTGLSLYDTWLYFTPFGQVVLLVLIQLGGLGVVTFATGFSLLLRKKLGPKEIALTKETTGIEGIEPKMLLKVVFTFTFGMETLAALILMLRFVPMGGAVGVWVAVFTSISAFCNAGFDIFSALGSDISTVTFSTDPLVTLTLVTLIVIGGIGFVVVSDIYLSKIRPAFHRNHRLRLSLHTKVVFIVTAALLFGGAVLFFLSEYHHALKDYGFFGKALCAFFQSATCRTAGFAPMDFAAQNDLSELLSIILMFIGGSPTSTAGGIKTTTVVILVIAVVSVLRGKPQPQFLKRRIDPQTVFQAMAIFFCGILVVILVSVVIYLSVEGANFLDSLYEATSAFSTTGLNATFPHSLSLVSKLSLTVAMFIGRVGPVSLGLFFVIRKNRRSESILPDGKILVG